MRQSEKITVVIGSAELNTIKQNVDLIVLNCEYFTRKSGVNVILSSYSFLQEKSAYTRAVITMDIVIKKAHINDLPSLEAIRIDAFKPVFESFRKILGEEIYELAQKKEDEQQHQILASMFDEDSNWNIFVAELNDEIIGFICAQLNLDTLVGEIGLNAISPMHSGKGFGTQMYNFVLDMMKARGIKVATVSTGADKSHEAARSAYKKAGFNVTIPSVWMCQLL